MKLLMNPTRQRIVQCIILKEQATPGELLEELSDVPKASLYRHIKLLLDGGLLEVAEETKVRGTLQRSYRLTESPTGGAPETSSEMMSVFGSGLVSIMTAFQRYFATEGCDPMADRLFLSTSTLMLSDEEFGELITGLGRLISDVLANKPGDGRKPRRITFISSPCEDDDL